MPLPGLELTTFRATREHSTLSPIGISHLASQVGISHHYARSQYDESLYEIYILSHIWSFSLPDKILPWMSLKGQIKVNDILVGCYS